MGPTNPTPRAWPQLPGGVPPSAPEPAFLLRSWRIEDAPALAEAWDDESINRWLSTPPATSAAARRWIEGCEDRRRTARAVDLVIEVEGQVAGEVGLSSFDSCRRAALIGYWVSAGHRGAGLASAAVALVAGWFFEELDGKALLAQCSPANLASQRVAEKAGFTRVGRDGGHQVYALTYPLSP